VLSLERTIESLERENAWLKAQLANIPRGKYKVAPAAVYVMLIAAAVIFQI
jgi:hypothetical protein